MNPIHVATRLSQCDRPGTDRLFPGIPPDLPFGVRRATRRGCNQGAIGVSRSLQPELRCAGARGKSHSVAKDDHPAIGLVGFGARGGEARGAMLIIGFDPARNRARGECRSGKSRGNRRTRPEIAVTHRRALAAFLQVLLPAPSAVAGYHARLPLGGSSPTMKCRLAAVFSGRTDAMPPKSVKPNPSCGKFN